MERGKNTQVAACLAQAEALLLDEEVERALTLVEKALEVHDHVGLWRFKKRLLIMLGEEAEAAALMTRILDLVYRPTPGELALVGSDRSAFTSLKDQKLLYLHVPKCGSTTVKDMLYHVLTGQSGEGHSHTLMQQQAPYRFLVRGALRENFADWFKFLVVRDPIARLRSYYRFNLCFTNDLAKEFGARDSYLGLALQPDYREFLQKLPRYRQVFRTLRAHTNALADIAGEDCGVYDWIGSVRNMADLRAALSEKTGVAIPAIHNFRSKDMATFTPDAALEDKVRATYARDYEAFGQFF
jgi:hypothetical protein